MGWVMAWYGVALGRVLEWVGIIFRFVYTFIPEKMCTFFYDFPCICQKKLVPLHCV